MTDHPNWIFGFWTGDNEMSPNRRRCFESFSITGLQPTLINAGNLASWVVPRHPLHEAYNFLSPVHRSDYLRAYFMHYYGGGYSDIKEHRGSWLPTLAKLASSDRFLGAGYREIRGGTVYFQNNAVNGQCFVLSQEVSPYTASLITNIMRAIRPLLIGNGAFFFKKLTPYTEEWLNEVERRLDFLLPHLIRNPARSPRDSNSSSTGYPVPWSFLMGDINGLLSAKYSLRMLRSLPRPDFENYQ